MNPNFWESKRRTPRMSTKLCWSASVWYYRRTWPALFASLFTSYNVEMNDTQTMDNVAAKNGH
jgi:hypothetical protein